MDQSLITGTIAALTLLPLTAYCWRAHAANDRIYWALLISAAAIFVGFLLYRLQTGWQRGLADTLFVCVTARIVIFALANHWFRESWRLSVLLELLQKMYS